MTTRQAHVREAPSRGNFLVYALLLGLAVTFGGVLWQSSQEREDQIPRVTAPTEPYKVRPPEGVLGARDTGESQGDALDASPRDEAWHNDPRLDDLRRDDLRRRDVIRRDEPRRDELPRDVRWRDDLRGDDLRSAQPEPRWRRPPATPYFVANGPYVAQVAALQSEADVEEAWRGLSSRAPELFESARLDVERADLGPRGIFYRIRAGYFSDRDNAERFCERVERMGQDCHVTGR